MEVIPVNLWIKNYDQIFFTTKKLKYRMTLVHDFFIVHRNSAYWLSFVCDIHSLSAVSEAATRCDFIHTQPWNLGWRRHASMSFQLHHISLSSLVCHFKDDIVIWHLSWVQNPDNHLPAHRGSTFCWLMVVDILVKCHRAFRLFLS